MPETLTERAAELRRTRVPFVHATVVRAERPTSAHAGDSALVHADGAVEGFVGGTCAEASVREYGLHTLQTNEPVLLRIVPDHRLLPAAEGSVTVVNPCLSGGSVEIFLAPHVPPPRVVLIGDTPIARALQALAAPLGWATERLDGDHPAIGPNDAAVVVASHGRGEEPALTAALRAGVPYVALVASRKRGAAVLAGLDVEDDQRDRVHSPAGLDLGGRTAGEIALSIAAEIVADLHRGRAAASAAPSAAPAGVADSARDPVCGMTVVASTASLHLRVPGRGGDGDTLVYFCGDGCRRAFAENPERYAAR